MSALLLPACVDGEIGERTPEPTTSIAASSENGLSVNGLLLRRPSLRRLRRAPLGAVKGKESLNGLNTQILFESEETDLEQTTEGRAILKYLATCALAQDTELVVETPVGEMVYPGLLGLAPQWAEGACDEDCEGWMSACLVAHANARGENVRISLRGDHPSLAPSPEEEESFGYEEAAFYGNVFGEDSKLYACLGEDAFLAPAGSDDSLRRLCSLGSCGVEVAGPCSDVFASAACATTSPYSSCTGDQFDATEAPYQNVITVMLESR